MKKITEYTSEELRNEKLTNVVESKIDQLDKKEKEKHIVDSMIPEYGTQFIEIDTHQLSQNIIFKNLLERKSITYSYNTPVGFWEIFAAISSNGPTHTLNYENRDKKILTSLFLCKPFMSDIEQIYEHYNLYDLNNVRFILPSQGIKTECDINSLILKLKSSNFIPDMVFILKDDITSKNLKIYQRLADALNCSVVIVDYDYKDEEVTIYKEIRLIIDFKHFGSIYQYDEILVKSYYPWGNRKPNNTIRYNSYLNNNFFVFETKENV